MTPLAIRDGGEAKVLTYVTEGGRASASLAASRYYSAALCGKCAFLRSTRLHGATPRQWQKSGDSTCRSSPGREGKKQSLPASCILPSNPKTCRLTRLRSH